MNRAQLLAGIAALAGLGCGASAPPTYDDKTIATASQFQKVAAAYMQAYQKNRRPPTAEDLKPLLKAHGDPDALLTSPLDGQPLVIVPVSPDAPPADGEWAIIAYERTGVNGKRMTVDSRGTIVFVTDDKFAKIKFAGGHKPAGK